jgi:hypothetical protein
MVEADETDKKAEISAMSVDAKGVATTASAPMDNKSDSDVATNASPVKVAKAAFSYHEMPIIHALADVTSIVAAQGSSKHIMPIIHVPPAGAGTCTDGATAIATRIDESDNDYENK